MTLESRVIPGVWLTIVRDIPDDRYAEVWATHCWRTTTPIRLVDDVGRVVREYHPTHRMGFRK